MTTEITVIIVKSWEKYHVFPATIEIAKKLVHEKIPELEQYENSSIDIIQMKKSFSDNPADLTIPYIVADSIILKAMSDVVNLKIGEESEAVCQVASSEPPRKRQTFPVTKEIQDELVLWLFSNKFDIRRSSATELERARPEKSLSFLAGLVSRAMGHPIKYVNKRDIEDAAELNQLLHGNWNPEAKVENVINRYLIWLTDNSSVDEEYNIGTFEQSI